MNSVWKFAVNARGRRQLVVGAAVVLGAAGVFMAVKARAAGIPATNALVYSGYLDGPDGKPMNGAVDVELTLWDSVSKGKKVCGVPSQSISPNSGHFEVQLPDDCSAAVADNPNLWLEPTVGGTSLGRSKLGAVPYAVEANHASTADTASGDLAAQLKAMQEGLDTLKARLDGPLTSSLTAFKSVRVDIVATNKTWTWVSGTDVAKLAPGRYWVFNTARVYSTAGGCVSNCTPEALVYLAACQKVGDKLTVSKGQVVAEAPRAAGVLASLPAAATDYFDFAAETDGVQLGLCARGSGDATTFDIAVADVSSVAMPQLK